METASSRSLRILEKVAGNLSLPAGYMAGFLLVACAVAIIAEIVSRKVGGQSLIWLNEFVTYALVGGLFGAAAYAQKMKQHVRVGLLTDRLSEWETSVWNIFVHSGSLLCVATLAWYYILFAAKSLALNEHGWGMWGPPIYPVKILMAVTLVIWAIQLLADLVSQIHTVFSQPMEKGGHRNLFVLVGLSVAFMVVVVVYLISKPQSGVGAFLMAIGLFMGWAVLGFPIAISLGLGGFLVLYHTFGITHFPSAAVVTYGALSNYVLIAVPLFIMGGLMMEKIGVVGDLFNAVRNWVGRVPGSMAITTIFCCALFAGICSDSTSTAATIGVVAFPILMARGYSRSLSAGVLSAGGTLGIMIPPSGALIIYAILTEESLGKLYFAGVLPGLLIAFLFCIYSMIHCRITGQYEEVPDVSWSERFKSLRNALPALGFPIVVFAGMLSGLYTAVEASAVTVVYALVIGVVLRKLKIRDLLPIITHTAQILGAVLPIFACAYILQAPLTMMRAPEALMNAIGGMSLEPWQLIGFIFVIYLICGMVMHMVTVLIISMPVFYPMVIAAGIDPIWFGVFTVLAIELAQITPPFAINLFVVQMVTGTKFSEAAKGVLPFVLILAIALPILWFFPQIVLWLPSLFGN